jgi:pimeloyl-ACP methyl ester carboxylesterase
MDWRNGETAWITIRGRKLEARTWGGPPHAKPAIVLLHEGLGSLGLWKSFPEKLAERTGYSVFAYSRAGYGYSDAAGEPWPLDFMTREAVEVLPELLDAIQFKRGILLGHSDGASIAAIYAGSIEDFRIRGLCLISPHFFTEPMGLAAIAQTRALFEQGDLRGGLAKHHADVDGVFQGWSGVWLDPAFKSWNIEDAIAHIRVPVLAIQGLDDQYGTPAQIEALVNGSYAPVDAELFESCKHFPHIERPERTLNVVSEFLARLGRIEAAGGEVSRKIGPSSA